MTEDQEEAELRAAVEVIRRTVRELEGIEVQPRLLAMALAQVAGEVGAGVAMAGDAPTGAILAGLAEFLRETGKSRERLGEAAGNA